MVEKLICNSNLSILEAIKIINKNSLGMIFIVDDNNKMLGTVTDGDIRRSLLKDIKTTEKISVIMNTDFSFGYEWEETDELLNKINYRVKIVPILNKEHQVVNFIEYKQEIYFPVALPNLAGNEFKYLLDAFLSTWISSSGKYIKRFEEDFAKFNNVSDGVAVSNGTVALHLALVALDIKEGDEVIVPDFTFAATINTVLYANATPVIVDIEKDSWCIDPNEIEKAITKNTKAIIPVHIYGQPCNMDAIMDIANRYDLKVIEDCAEAHGAEYNGKKVGSFGDIGCFSFYGNKIITTGEGGMCITNDKLLDEKMRVLRDHGMSKDRRYWHDVVGYNYRMTNMQAAVGVAQLERIDQILDNRKEFEDSYSKILEKFDFINVQNKDIINRKKVTWLVSILLENNDSCNRDELIDLLKESGVDARPFFYPLSVMDIYKKYVFSNKISKEISKKGLNLPTYETLMEKETLIKKVENVLLTLLKRD